MASNAPDIELTDIGDLADLVEEVRQSRRPRILRRGGEDVAMLVPAPLRRSRRTVKRLRLPTTEQAARSRAGIEAAAGTWSGVDVDELKAELRRQRDVVTRPPVDL